MRPTVEISDHHKKSTEEQNDRAGGHMAKVFQSLKETLHRSKTTSTASPRVQGSGTAILNDAMHELENLVSDGIGKLKAAARDSQAVLVDEAQNAQQRIESLSENVSVLEARLTETEDTIRKKDLQSQTMEDSLSSKIRDLESALNEKDEALQSRDSEVSDLNSKIVALVEQGTQFELRIQQATDQAAREALRADSISETSQVRIGTLEAQLRNTEEIVARRDAAIKALEGNLTAKIEDLENDMRNKDALLVDRNRQVTDLKTELRRLTSAMKEMSAVFRQAEALADIQAQAIGGEQVKTAEEKRAILELQDTELASSVSDAVREAVPRDTFDRVIDEIAKHTKVMTPLASLVVLDHVEALGESMDNFPQRRLTELLEALSREISDDKLRTGFRERLGKAMNFRSEPTD
jgi:chromosome segregation ATPase